MDPNMSIVVHKFIWFYLLLSLCYHYSIEWNPLTEELLCGGSHGFCVYKISDVSNNINIFS